MGSARTFLRWAAGRQSRWNQPSHTSHWIHWTGSRWGSRHRGAAQGSGAPATPPSSPSPSSSEEPEEEEEEELEEEEAEEVEDEDEEEGEGREGRGRRGCFLGRPRRFLRGERERENDGIIQRL